MDTSQSIKKAAEAIDSADALLFTAGAGMGVDSGLPDFRGNEGFWKAYPPIAKLGKSFTDMANPRWFKQKPELAWAFYGHRLNMYRNATPHSGFEKLKKMAENKPKGYFVYTSNVDGHFQKAGFTPDRIVECHGSINHIQCAIPCDNTIHDGKDVHINVNEEIFEAVGELPRCPKCGGIARPNILMFGDWYWIGDRTYAQEDALNDWFADIKDSNLVVIECGAGTSVPTVRYKSEDSAARNGNRLIRINPREEHVPEGHISIQLGAEEGISKIFEELN